MKREDGTEKRNDEGRIDWGAQHPIGRIARRWYRSAFRYFCFGLKHVLSSHITHGSGTARTAPGDGYFTSKCRSSKWETPWWSLRSPLLKGQHLDKRRHRLGTPTPRCKFLAKPREDLRGGRRKRCDSIEFRALGRRMRRWHDSRDSRSLQGPTSIKCDKAPLWR